MEILKNSVGVVTGGAGFMGPQHINAILKNGGKAVVIDIDRKKVNALKIKYRNFFPHKILFIVGDITKEKFVKNCLKKITKEYGKVDILINNAAIDYFPQKKNNKFFFLETFDVNIFKKDLNVSLTGALICTKIFGSQMAKNKKGVILNIASDLGIISPDNRVYNEQKKSAFVKPVSYSISKHGIIGLTKYTATYWANKNIRCNALAPGGILNNQNKNFLKKINKLIPLGRLAKKGEYENAILFLISDDSSYMTGSTMVLDGGRTAW
jgi:NAD(P)-dependent dehydrogenase (short-subunit alcohol dehydrogenase family)